MQQVHEQQVHEQQVHEQQVHEQHSKAQQSLILSISQLLDLKVTRTPGFSSNYSKCNL